MKHRIFGKKLGRNHNERQALIRSLVKAIFIHGSIQTTMAKSELIVSEVESLSTTIMTKPELIAKRELFKTLQNQAWVNNVVKTMKETFSGQTSNFTQVVKVGKRFGDDSLMVRLSFVKPVKFEITKKKEVPQKAAKTEKTVKAEKPKKEVKKVVKKETK
jgi:large subunit ribosomal protein L17